MARSLGKTHEVNSMHHQGIAKVGRGLRPVAVAEDGLIEALEVPQLPFFVGVQWHPEELAKTDQMSSSLFYSFVRAAAGDWRSAVPADWPAQLRQMGIAQPWIDNEAEFPANINGASVQSSAEGHLHATTHAQL